MYFFVLLYHRSQLGISSGFNTHSRADIPPRKLGKFDEFSTVLTVTMDNISQEFLEGWKTPLSFFF